VTRMVPHYWLLQQRAVVFNTMHWSADALEGRGKIMLFTELFSNGLKSSQ